MVVGHTKFVPDGCFGLLKRAFWKTEVSSLADIEQVVQSSSTVNKCQLVGSQMDHVIVPVRLVCFSFYQVLSADWYKKITISIFLHPIPGSSNYSSTQKLKKNSIF